MTEHVSRSSASQCREVATHTGHARLRMTVDSGSRRAEHHEPIKSACAHAWGEIFDAWGARLSRAPSTKWSTGAVFHPLLPPCFLWATRTTRFPSRPILKRRQASSDAPLLLGWCAFGQRPQALLTYRYWWMELGGGGREQPPTSGAHLRVLFGARPPVFACISLSLALGRGGGGATPPRPTPRLEPTLANDPTLRIPSTSTILCS